MVILGHDAIPYSPSLPHTHTHTYSIPVIHTYNSNNAWGSHHHLNKASVDQVFERYKTFTTIQPYTHSHAPIKAPYLAFETSSSSWGRREGAGKSWVKLCRVLFLSPLEPPPCRAWRAMMPLCLAFVTALFHGFCCISYLSYWFTFFFSFVFFYKL